MDIFYKETQANLPAGLCSTLHPPMENKAEGTGVQLLTPDSWNIPLTDARRKAPSPVAAAGQSQGPGPSASTTVSPSDTANCSVTKIPTPVPKSMPISETANIPPVSVQPPASIGPPLGVPPRSPPMVMTNRGPVPLPIFMEQQIMQQIRPPFIRGPPHHASNPNSPLSNPMLPGILSRLRNVRRDGGGYCGLVPTISRRPGPCPVSISRTSDRGLSCAF